MINNSTPESKIDEAVKATLNNYEAPFDAGDWSRMESMLDAAPKQGSFKWSGSLTAVVVGIAVIGGSYFLYQHYSTGSSNSATAPATEEKAATPPPVVTTPKVTTPAATTAAPAETATTPPAVLPPAKENVVSQPVADAQKVKEEKLTTKTDKTNHENGSAYKGQNDEEHSTTQKIMGMGNEPIFGDMLDSSKGIIGETREKEETKKAAKASKNTPVGWNNILPNVNIDSLRKYRQQRDSVKVQ